MQIFLEWKHQPDLMSTFVTAVVFSSFCVDKDPVMMRHPGTEMKRNHQLLFSAFSLPMQDKK